MRRPVFLTLALAAVTTSLDLRASPPSWAPSDITQTITVECEPLVASVDFSSAPRRPTLSGSFAIAQVSLFTSDRRLANTELQRLPATVSAMESPFVHRVVPTCTDNGISFVFHLVPEESILLPSYRSTKPVTRLYVDLTKKGDTEIYVLKSS